MAFAFFAVGGRDIALCALGLSLWLSLASRVLLGQFLSPKHHLSGFVLVSSLLFVVNAAHYAVSVPFAIKLRVSEVASSLELSVEEVSRGWHHWFGHHYRQNRELTMLMKIHIACGCVAMLSIILQLILPKPQQAPPSRTTQLSPPCHKLLGFVYCVTSLITFSSVFGILAGSTA